MIREGKYVRPLFDWAFYADAINDVYWREDYKMWATLGYPESMKDEEIDAAEIQRWADTIREEEWEDFCDGIKSVTMNDPIVCFAELDLWSGVAKWHKLLGRNAGSCLDVDHWEEPTFYLNEDWNLSAKNSHRDGINHYHFFNYTCGDEELEAMISSGNVEDLELAGVLKRMGVELIDKMPGYKRLEG